jgi:hypothetical protein
MLSQKQLAKEFSTKENTTIETDETSKFGTKYSVYSLRDSKGMSFVFRLRELTTKSGKDTLHALREILFDLDHHLFLIKRINNEIRKGYVTCYERNSI